jgi:hypothetical protein
MPVQSVTEDEQLDSLGNTTPVYVITFTAGNPPSSFTVTVPQTGDPVAAAKQAIEQVTGQVDAIFGL